MLLVLLAAAAASCSGGGRREPDGPGEGPVPAYETYVKNPTEIRAEEVRAIFPAAYSEKISLTGLSDGWREEEGSRVWEGSGSCSLSLHRLKVSCRALTVTLVEEQKEPEVMIQATGDVYIGHGVRSVATYAEHLSFLLLRNDRRLER
jgi:hypothetical protein